MYLYGTYPHNKMEVAVLCVRLVTGNRRLRKAGIVILLAVCLATGLLVWGRRSSFEDKNLAPAQFQLDNEQDSRRRSEGEEGIVKADLAGDSQQKPHDVPAEVAVGGPEKENVDPRSVHPPGAVKSSLPNSEAVDGSCLKWCRRGNGANPPYYITAVLLVRIYVIDPAKLTTREMLQWLQYLRYAGFEHVYVYDAYRFKNESQKSALRPFLDDGYVTYVDWSHKAYPYSIQGTQVAAYQDCMNQWGRDSEWQAAIDIDEYPFSTVDTGENFMPRFLRQYSNEVPNAAEITMHNFLFLGKPLSEAEHPLLVDRIWRRTHTPANALVKPIYRPAKLGGAQVCNFKILRSSQW